MKRAWRQLVPPAVGLVLFLLPVPHGLSANAWHYFALFAATLTALVLEAMPPGAVGLIGITLAGLLGYVDADPAKSLKWMLSGFSESTVWLVVGAFVFSSRYRQTRLGKRVARVLVRAFGRHTLGLGYAI